MSELPDDLRAGLRPPQFKLSTLLWGMALLAVLSALVGYFGVHSALILGFFVLVVAAHVAGNALGTQLRDSGNRPLARDEGQSVIQPIRRVPKAEEFAPRTQLSDRRALGLPIVIATIVGGLLAAFGGGVLMLVLPDPVPTRTAIVAGTIACGTLGGIWTYVGFGFIQVAGGAFRQATRKVEQNRESSKTG